MKITVYDGAGVIGGNKILLETNGSSFFFDFGISYSIWSSYFEEYLKPRAARGIVDPFKVGLLPPLDGIYRDDFFPSAFNMQDHFEGHPEFRKLDLTAVLLSHAHLDHSGHISFLRENIPIYCSPLTAAISKAVQDTSQNDFEKEVCYKIPKE
jgi:ribonuclease J